MASYANNDAKKNILICAFSNLDQYKPSHIRSIIGPDDHITIVSPYDDIYLIKYLKWLIVAFCRRIGIRLDVDRSTLEWSTCITLRHHLIRLGYCKKNIRISKINTLTAFLCLAKYPSFLKNAFNLLDDRPAPLLIESVESSGYILDSLQRWSKLFRIDYANSLTNIVITFIYLCQTSSFARQFAQLCNTSNFSLLVLNHNVYFESGWLGCYISECLNLPVYHISSIQKLPSISVPRTFWYEPLLKSSSPNVLESSTSTPWYETTAVANLPDLRHLQPDFSRVIVFLHAFSDANNMHYHPKMLFRTYYNWAYYTLRLASKMTDKNFIFRIHPATSKYYAKDISLIDKMFSNLPAHIMLEEPSLDNSNHFESSLPLVVTCRGSIALEMACSGVKTICAYRSNAPNSTYYLPSTRHEYTNLIACQSGLSLTLNNSQVLVANAIKSQLSSFLSAS